MKEILIAVITILLISVSVNIYHFNRVDKLTTELSIIKIERAVELDEFNRSIEKSKLAMVELEKHKAEVVTKYIPIPTAELNSCEDKMKAIEDMQKLFFEVQR